MNTPGDERDGVVDGETPEVTAAADAAGEEPQATASPDGGPEPSPEPAASDDAPDETPDDGPTPADADDAARLALQAALAERDAALEQARRDLADLQGRLRKVSKAYTEQKQEMAGFRDRVEAQAQVRQGRREFDLAKAFFEPVQNLKRSLDVDAADVATLKDGLRMVLHQFQDGLHRLGLEPVPGVGAPFDPNLHEALAVSPVSDPEQDGKVLMVHVDGYAVGGRALQPAQVVVGKHTPQAEVPEA